MSAEPQREWFEKDYYKILGVTEKAGESEITKAYHKLAKRLHPDANQGDAASEDKFKEVSSAYDVLGDAEKREAYDEVRRLGPLGGGFGPRGPGSPGGFGPGGFDFDFSAAGRGAPSGDLGDLLGGLFGQRGPQARGSRRGDDLHADLRLEFGEAVAGTTTAVSLVSDAPCRTCGGSGAEPGTKPTHCDACGGSGTTAQNQGLFSFSRPCGSCAGRGHAIDSPCQSCAGRGLERRRRQVKTRIPAGVVDGQQIKLKGRGGPGVNGGRPGDLYVRVRVSPHPLFGRDGKNLTLSVPVSFAEAALGADIRVPMLDGSAVTIRIPPGTAGGRRLRVHGKADNGSGAGGADLGGADLIVVVEVVVPERLSEEQRAAVEAFAAASADNPRAHLEA